MYLYTILPCYQQKTVSKPDFGVETGTLLERSCDHKLEAQLEIGIGIFRMTSYPGPISLSNRSLDKMPWLKGHLYGLYGVVRGSPPWGRPENLQIRVYYQSCLYQMVFLPMERLWKMKSSSREQI